MTQNKIQSKLFQNKRKKGYIRKTRSNNITDLLDHSRSKRLFRQNYNQTFYQLNILTKTQNIRCQQDQRAKTKANSRIKHDRLEQLCAPKKKRYIFMQQHQKNKTTSKSIRSKKQSVSQPKEIPPIIFKSNLVAIEKREQIKDSKKETQNTEISDKQQEQDIVKKELQKLQTNKIVGKHKLPVITTSQNRNWINKIFDKGVYEDKYQQINQFLLKKENLYRQRGFNLTVERQWRF